MTAADLILRLQVYPPGMDVIIRKDNDEFTYGEIDTIEVKNIRFCEDEDYPHNEPYCDTDCIVISST